MRTDEQVLITTFVTGAAATRAKVILQAAGIAAQLQRPVYGGRGSPSTRLLVEREDAMEAASILGITS